MGIELTNPKTIFPNNINRDQCKDTGMAMVLICLLIGYIGQINGFIGAAVIVLVINMIWPKGFYPIAVIWFGFSNILGMLMSNILLMILFFILVAPIGLIRRATGGDSLMLRQWKKDQSSVFKIRNIDYKPEDIEKPY
jgi:hypothetical protein